MTHWPELSVKRSHNGVKHPVMTPGPDTQDRAGVIHNGGSRKNWNGRQSRS